MSKYHDGKFQERIKWCALVYEWCGVSKMSGKGSKRQHSESLFDFVEQNYGHDKV